jgi:hypothetical protein
MYVLHSEVVLLSMFNSSSIIYNISVVYKFLCLAVCDVWYHLMYTVNIVHYYALLRDVWCSVKCMFMMLAAVHCS